MHGLKKIKKKLKQIYKKNHETTKMGKQVQELILMVGPEGDLIPEKKLLVHAGFTFCSLTPTVLRSVQAIALGLGMFRSVLRK